MQKSVTSQPISCETTLRNSLQAPFFFYLQDIDFFYIFEDSFEEAT